MQFIKMHGAGNDYVYVDCFREQVPGDFADVARAVSDRHTGVGGDGLVLITPSEQAPVRMRMFNADGSEAEMCGNGVRCVAKYAYERGLVPRAPTMRVETGAGVKGLALTLDGERVERITVNMGRPLLDRTEIEYIPATAIALIYLGLGDEEQSIAWLERAHEQRDVWLIWLREAPEFASLYGDPRFQDLLGRLPYPDKTISDQHQKS